ncbi:hypothetical protein GCM10028803_45530 [Larkinella knui]|uniref:Uncharacterized protein n=1 Tax=Larkinella knui TaxID=2025310 RepID=A0A3P1CP99_9BACT|nr:hypothetical protein [Larkinella knui]RRB15157.1 hypothetical protein EHT87_11455 [Larkinella knui]
MRNLVCFIVLSFLLPSGCKRENEGFDPGGPITRYLQGRWQLEKIVAPSGTKTGSQIGYTEIIESGNNQVEDYDKIFRNGSLINTYVWSRSAAPILNASDMTVTLTYDNGVKRFFKIKQQPGKTTLETSGYLSQIGAAQDSVKYHYISVQ